ncbi:MAG: transposase family protein [Proteobacteria bacterium]|nr:transposase family protein [Pseudomonadota bacterium]
MKLDELKTIEQISQFIDGTQKVIFKTKGCKRERYHWITSQLVKFKYSRLNKKDKGTVITYLRKVTAYSKSQTTRLIYKYIQQGKITFKHVVFKGFKCKYTNKDIRNLAKLDSLHDRPCGQRVKKLLNRAYHVFHEPEFERLADISVSHIYNLRKTTSYQRINRHFEKTKSKPSSIGTRKKPQPNGKPGYIRIDTVHQGDKGKHKGVYHINAIDEVTQFEVVYSVEKISEQYMIPALAYMMDFFPFKIINMHSDNGSEYINYTVARLLEKLRVELTKSRARHSNDNALVEAKNASIIRKNLGYIHIPQHHADLLNKYNQRFLNPHINYHRPCLFPQVITDKKGKEKKIYPYEMMNTPYEKLKSLANAHKYLKKGKNFEKMDEVAYKITDNQSADLLQQARSELFNTIDERDLNLA